jgi:hypothetical protein
MVKRALTILAIAALHFITSLVLFGIVYSRGMAAFDSGAEPTAFDSVLGRLTQVLLFPFIPLAQYMDLQSGE